MGWLTSIVGLVRHGPKRIEGLCILASLLCLITVSGCASSQVVTKGETNTRTHASPRKTWDQVVNETRQKAAQGDREAQYELARLFKTGLAGSRDALEAEKWYRLAAEQGHMEAQFNLAALYESGMGIPQDMHRAGKWYRLAAEQGHADAQYSLATLYESGLGVTLDDQQAKKWYRLAAEQGHEMAIEALCKWNEACQDKKWQERQRRRQEQLVREREQKEAEAREQQRKVDEARKLGERLGTIGIVILPSYKRIMEKTPKDWDLPTAEEIPEITAASVLYLGPFAPAGALGIGFAYVLKWISDGADQAMYQSKEEVRKAKAAIKDALENTKIAESIRDHTVERVSSRLGTQVVFLDQPQDMARIADGSYDQVREQAVDTLIMFNDLRIGLVGSTDTAMFVIQADMSVIDVVHKAESHKQTLTYTGDSLELAHWIDNNADAFLGELEKAYDTLAENAVNSLITAMSTPLLTGATPGNMKITALATEQNHPAAQQFECKTRYCGNYYGYLVVKGPSRTEKMPIKITVGDGQLSAAIESDEGGDSCRSTGSTPIHVRHTGKSKAEYEATCDIVELGSCQIQTKIKGEIEEGRLRNELQLFSKANIQCPQGNYEVSAKATAMLSEGVSTEKLSSGMRYPDEIETLLRNVGANPIAGVLLDADTRVLR